MRTKDFLLQDQTHTADRLTHIITDFPVLATVDTGYPVTHLAVSCDDLTLAVAVSDRNNPIILQYDVREFASQVS